MTEATAKFLWRLNDAFESHMDRLPWWADWWTRWFILATPWFIFCLVFWR